MWSLALLRCLGAFWLLTGPARRACVVSALRLGEEEEGSQVVGNGVAEEARSELPVPRVRDSLRLRDSLETVAETVARQSQTVREGSRVSATGERLGQKCFRLDIVEEFMCVDCVMRNARRDYVITEGALLGTARGGFLIPWDSDGDISFDIRGANGTEDIEGFYRLFSRESLDKVKDNCSCGTLTMTHFIGNLFEGSTALHSWQTWEEIRSFNLLAAEGNQHIPTGPDKREFLTELLKRGHDTRIFASPDPGQVRDGGGGYIDVEPFYIGRDAEGHKLPGQWTNLAISVNVEDVLPLRRCETLHFGEANVTRLELSCPKKPSVLLEEYYGKEKAWLKVPYNKYDDQQSKWVLDPSPDASTLQAYVARRYNFTGNFSPFHDLNDSGA